MFGNCVEWKTLLFFVKLTHIMEIGIENWFASAMFVCVRSLTALITRSRKSLSTVSYAIRSYLILSVRYGDRNSFETARLLANGVEGRITLHVTFKTH